MSLLNPMNVGAPGAPYQQPSGNPTPNPYIANFPTGANVMGLSWPLPPYAQPDALFPSAATMQNNPGSIHPHEVT
jgi:hypothetical protein